jgi:hypothetical protein
VPTQLGADDLQPQTEPVVSGESNCGGALARPARVAVPPAGLLEVGARLAPKPASTRRATIAAHSARQSVSRRDLDLHGGRGSFS